MEVELALYQRIPIKKERRNKVENTYEGNEEFIRFKEELEKEVVLLKPADIQIELENKKNGLLELEAVNIY